MIRLFLFFALSLATLGGMACDPVQMSHQKPGPVGCGLKDPRKTAPGKLSLGQKKILRERGTPGQVKPNNHGGLDWVYLRRSGSVFGEEEQVERFVFDAQGVLLGRDAELIYKKGK
jgi:hypothetical protein